MLEAAGTIVGVAVGVGLTFLAISLLVTTIVELINSIFALRAVNLRDGIRRLLDDPDFTGLAKMLYEHPRITPLGRTKEDPNFVLPANLPSQVDRTQFAKALLDVTGLSAALGTSISGAETASALARVAAIGNVRTQQLLQGVVYRTAGDVKQIESEIAAWFDVAIDRVNVRFETGNLLRKLCLALLVAVIFNVNAIQAVSRFWEQLSAASDHGSAAPILQGTAGDHGPSASVVQGAQIETEQEIYEKRMALRQYEQEKRLPIGWARGHYFEVADFDGNWYSLWDLPSALFWSLVGWLITSIMAVLGAPFWGDIFQKLVGAKVPPFGSDKEAKGTVAGD
jgi:hypothetical protein